LGIVKLPTKAADANVAAKPTTQQLCMLQIWTNRHIRDNCMKLKQGLRTAAAMQDELADPAMDPVEDPNLLIEGKGEPQDEDQNEELLADEWEPEEAQYQFDDEEDTTENNTVTYQTSMIRLALDNVATMKVVAVHSKPAALKCITIGASSGCDLTGHTMKTVP
jgi:hypothetical protein